MADRQSATDDAVPAGDSEALLRSGLEQVREDSRLYNQALGSFNTHLDNHRERCDLSALPFRRPITAHDAYDRALLGDRAALRSLLSHLLKEERRDSRVRRHPRTYPIHREAVEHMAAARDQLVSTIEETLLHLNEGRESPPPVEAD